MKIFNRRDFIRSTSLNIGTLILMTHVNKAFSAPKSVPLNQNFDRNVERSFDPWLDKNCKIFSRKEIKNSQSMWMWYPGQKTAHISARRVQDAMERCNNMGYPGSFCQPEHYLFCRKIVYTGFDSELQWTGPISRIRMSIDGKQGDITSRNIKIPAGKHLIELTLDFSRSLPCILIEGAGLSSMEGWLVSLDQKIWVEPEFEKSIDFVNILPDDKREVVVEIPVGTVISKYNVTKTEAGFSFLTGGNLILDFWHDELGELAFIAKGKGQLTIQTGESLTEVQDTDPNHFEQKPIPAIALHQYPQNITTPERCIRFAAIRSDGSCTIENLNFKAKITPVEYKGSFTCSDNELNKVWEAGAATIHSCMHDFYLDGIKRDAMSWADAIMGMMAADCVFFDTNIARNSIVSQLLPLNPTATDFGIIDFPAFTYLGFEHDYLVRGELNFVKSYKQNLFDLLDLYSSLQDEKGFISGEKFQNWGFFPDWSITDETGPDRFGIPCYAQMLIMKSFEIGAEFSRLFNDSLKVENYSAIALKIRNNIRYYFWDFSEGAFLNGFDSKGRIDKRLTSFAQVWGILFDLIKPEEYKTVFNKVLDNPERKNLSVSLNQLFEGQAYAKAGRTESFLKRIKMVWGEMLRMGYSRFAEDIRPWQNPTEQLALYGRPYGNSLCHVWSGATVVLALSRSVLGIYPTKPGFSECVIEPKLAGLEWIKGSIPVPSGSIFIELYKEKGGKLILPTGVKARLVGFKTKTGDIKLTGPGEFNVEMIADHEVFIRDLQTK